MVDKLTIFLIATLVVLVLLFGVVSYISWGTKIGTSIRYYYYAHAILALGIVVTVVTLIVTDLQRRERQHNASWMRNVRINQHYWIHLERFFSEHAMDLNRLYKQMWPHAADVQSLPDLPVTNRSRVIEVHAANMLMGIINNINSAVVGDKPREQVWSLWQQPEYRSWFRAIQNWTQSEILRKRWYSTREVYSPQMRTLMDALTGSRCRPAAAAAAAGARVVESANHGRRLKK